jgi:hypothetical protein
VKYFRFDAAARLLGVVDYLRRGFARFKLGAQFWDLRSFCFLLS